jgi:hypothetical protein
VPFCGQPWLAQHTALPPTVVAEHGTDGPKSALWLHEQMPSSVAQ